MVNIYQIKKYLVKKAEVVEIRTHYKTSTQNSPGFPPKGVNRVLRHIITIPDRAITAELSLVSQ